MSFDLQTAYCDVRLKELVLPAYYYFACGQDISAMSAVAKVRSSVSSSTVIVTLNSPTDITLDSDGMLTVKWTSAHFTSIFAVLGTADGVWDVVITPVSGAPQVAASGPISCSRTVSR